MVSQQALGEDWAAGGRGSGSGSGLGAQRTRACEHSLEVQQRTIDYAHMQSKKERRMSLEERTS